MFNPFDILNLEKSYSLDPSTLEKHYFEAQKKNHPDQFSQADAQQKGEAVRKSTIVNQAYLMLKNPLQRAEYLLQEAGVGLLSSDPTFLEQVMAWNERLDRGENLTLKLHDEQAMLLKKLEEAFDQKDYDTARVAVYRLTYVQKLVKQRGRG